MNDNPIDGLYRVGDLAMFRAGDNQTLVFSRDNHAVQFVPANVLDLLMHCREFKSLDDHIRSYCQGRPVNSITIHAMREELDALALQGYLISSNSLSNGMPKRLDSAPPPPITSLCFPTCNRVETLRRGLISYIHHCQRFDRSIAFVVADDSLGPDTRQAYQRMLREVKTQYSVNIAYAGFEEKAAFAQKLEEVSGVPSPVVHFALVGDKAYEVTTVGANRNSLLLHTVGELIFSVDDDTICQPAALPVIEDGLCFNSIQRPEETWFFSNRGRAIEFTRSLYQDVLALHEQWLGKTIDECLASRVDNHSIRIDEASPDWLRRLKINPGRIALSVSGMMGDSGWDNPHYYLFQPPDTFKRLVSDKEYYEMARTSREIIQVANRATVTEQANSLLAMCISLDNRDLLPPFSPVSRGEELVFGTLLAKCWDSAHIVHLPWMLLHAPTERRSFRQIENVFALASNTWLRACLGSFDPGIAQSPAERLHKAGLYLEELGQLPPSIFDDLIRLNTWNSLDSLVLRLEERLQTYAGTLSSFWVEDVKSFIVLARQSAISPVEELYAVKGGREAIQNWLLRFGKVLQHWPQLVEAARTLRQSGYRLAQPIK